MLVYSAVVVVMAAGLWCGWRFSAHRHLGFTEARITALETRMALVESNSVETVQTARKVQADLGRLSEAVLRWRMSLPTNRVSAMTNIPNRKEGNP